MTLADTLPAAPTPVETGVVPALPDSPTREAVRPGRSTAAQVEWVLLGLAYAVAGVAVVLRFIGPKALWLDETLTVNIARLPLGQLFDALRHDGSPPAYYVALHYWMGVFGTGTWSVRALAGVLSVATLPVAYRLGRALGGRRLAAVLVVLMATDPFALRYATENRMYSLVMLLVTLAALSLVRLLQKPTILRLVGFGVLCGLLMLTHYWALYLMAGLGCCLLVASLRGQVRARARMALVALCGGALLFLPWAPSFWFQAHHTGTPWATASSPMMLIEAVGEFAGWEQHAGVVLFVFYGLALAVLACAVVLRAAPQLRRYAVAVGWRRPVAGSRFVLPTVAVALITMVVAMLGGMVASAAFAYRYASVVMPLVVLLVAIGVAAVGRTKLGGVAAAVALLVMALLGTTAGVHEILGQRTEAVLVAAQIAANARPGDVVAYCPDQLGPAVSRLLPNRLLTQVTFPRFDDPQRINWVDYAQVNAAANPDVFARQVLNLAGEHDVWLVWEGGYRTFGRSCQQIRNTLEAARPDHAVEVRSQPSRYYEHESLVRFLP